MKRTRNDPSSKTKSILLAILEKIQKAFAGKKEDQWIKALKEKPEDPRDIKKWLRIEENVSQSQDWLGKTFTIPISTKNKTITYTKKNLIGIVANRKIDKTIAKLPISPNDIIWVKNRFLFKQNNKPERNKTFDIKIQVALYILINTEKALV